MVHEPSLSKALRQLLCSQRVAALGTLTQDGKPFVSMVPFAIDAANGVVVIHVSQLAAHARNLQRSPEVSLLVMQAEVEAQAVHALPRVTLEGIASVPAPGSATQESACAAYLQRFPDVAFMTQLGDFYFVTISVLAARQVAGFGAARTIAADELALLMRTPQ